MATYTDTQKQDAVDLYLKHGTAEAARRTGITGRSIIRWANKSGVSQDKAEQTEAAREALAAKNAERRERIRSSILVKVEDILGRMDMPHHDYRAAGKELHRVEWDTARSGDVKNYAVSMAILLDKYRLEMGESTSRTEVSLTDAESVFDQSIRELEAKLSANDP